MDPDYVYTLTMAQAEAEALARGDVPARIQNDVISLLIDVRATPGDALASMARRNPRRPAEPRRTAR